MMVWLMLLIMLLIGCLEVLWWVFVLGSLCIVLVGLMVCGGFGLIYVIVR